jgi:hypothetical protein
MTGLPMSSTRGIAERTIGDATDLPGQRQVTATLPKEIRPRPSIGRPVLGLAHLSEEAKPLIYLARAAGFAAIIIAIIRKNRATNFG